MCLPAVWLPQLVQAHAPQTQNTAQNMPMGTLNFRDFDIGAPGTGGGAHNKSLTRLWPTRLHSKDATHTYPSPILMCAEESFYQYFCQA